MNTSSNLTKVSTCEFLHPLVKREIDSLLEARSIEYSDKLLAIQKNYKDQDAKNKDLFQRVVTVGLSFAISLSLPSLGANFLLSGPIVFIISCFVFYYLLNSCSEYFIKWSTAEFDEITNTPHVDDFSSPDLTKFFSKIDLILRLFRFVKNVDNINKILELSHKGLNYSDFENQFHYDVVLRVLGLPHPDAIVLALLSNFDFWKSVRPIDLDSRSISDEIFEIIICKLNSLNNADISSKILQEPHVIKAIASWDDFNKISFASLLALLEGSAPRLIIPVLSRVDIREINPEVLYELLASKHPKKLEIVTVFFNNPRFYKEDSPYKLDSVSIRKLLSLDNPLLLLTEEVYKFLKIPILFEVNNPLAALQHIKKNFTSIKDEAKFDSEVYNYILIIVKKDMSLMSNASLILRNMPFPVDSYIQTFSKCVAVVDDPERNSIFEYSGMPLGVCPLFIQDLHRISLFIEDGGKLSHLNSRFDSSDPYPDEEKEVIPWKKRRIEKLQAFCGTKKLFKLSQLCNQSFLNIFKEVISTNSSNVFLPLGSFTVTGIEEGTKLIISKNKDNDIVLEALQVLEQVEQIFWNNPKKPVFKQLNPHNSRFSFNIKITLKDEEWCPNKDSWIKYRFHFPSK